MKTLNIDRKTWLRGEGHSKTFLLRSSDNKLDCFGFLALDLGFSKDELSNLPTPAAFATMTGCEFEPGILTFKHHNSKKAIKIMKINDDPSLNDEKRQKKLTKKFKKLNISLNFIN